MTIGEGILMKCVRGHNETFDKNIKEGEFYVEFRVSKEVWKEIRLHQQPLEANL